METRSRQLRIAYYSINDPLDKRSWSGITYYMGQALKNHVGEVHFLGPVKIPWLLDKCFRALQKLSRFLSGREWIPKYSLLKNVYAALILRRRMKGQAYDVLVAPAAASELAYLRTRTPIVYYGDATYKIYSETYRREFHNLSPLSRWEGEHLEKKALQKSDLVIFSSQWAVNSAVRDYQVPPEKIEVIQLGANIDAVPEYSSIFDKEDNGLLTLLFLSVDWDRKGGPIAYHTLRKLNHTERKARLIVCGCTPPDEYRHPCMEVIPFLNKNDPGDLGKFYSLMASVHFLLLPTRADCTPLVNCEANAYGIPAITTDVGGITEAVKDGINGYCLPPEADGNAYASLIEELFYDKKRYHRLIETSRQRFDEELNWERFAQNFKRVLNKHQLG